MDLLKLIALDAEDLGVLSAHLQDASVQVSEIAYVPREKRFAMVVSRFNWHKALEEGSSTAEAGALERRLSAFRAERVLGAQYKGLVPGKRGDVLNLLAVEFEAGEPPSGALVLLFSGGAAIRLSVECIEIELRDLGAAWEARSMPVHPDE